MEYTFKSTPDGPAFCEMLETGIEFQLPNGTWLHIDEFSVDENGALSVSYYLTSPDGVTPEVAVDGLLRINLYTQKIID